MQAIANVDSSRVGELTRETELTFEAKHTRTDRITIRKGFGVWCSLVYAGEGEPSPDEPVACDIGVVRLEPAACTFVGGALCVRIGDNAYIPVENFGDDEEDLASDRYFETEAEAEAHVKYVSRALNWRGIEVA